MNITQQRVQPVETLNTEAFKVPENKPVVQPVSIEPAKDEAVPIVTDA